MKRKLSDIRILSLVIIAGIAISSCNKDETNTDVIVGNWTSGTSSFHETVGNMTLTQYIIDVMGGSQDDAQLYKYQVEETMRQAFTGYIQVKSDSTYKSNLGGSASTGTWSLNSDRTELTIDSSTEVPVTFDIVALTSSSLHLHIFDDANFDFNEDGTDEIVTVEADVNFSK